MSIIKSIAMIKNDKVFWIHPRSYQEYLKSGWIKAQDYYRQQEAHYAELRVDIEKQTALRALK